MSNKDYDFAGWATKNDILVSDGVVIQHGAFAANDHTTVPLVWNHKRDIPGNILGHAVLTQYPEGTYAHGYFNDTETAQMAKSQLQHGDISAMSIGANHIKRNGNRVVGGKIFEVSLVVSPANPGALIDEVVQHSDDEGGETAIIYNGLLIHSADDEEPGEKEGATPMADEPTATPAADPQDHELSQEEIFDSMNPAQQEFVANLAEALTEDEEQEEEEQMQHNAFNDANGASSEDQSVLLHSALTDVLLTARDNQISFKKALEQSDVLEHADTSNSISNIEELFPNAKLLNTPPMQIVDPNTGTEAIINGVSRSPFSRVKNMWTDLTDMTDEQARAKGYIKGSEKVDSVIKVAKRESSPAMIYIKNKLDRQDIIDITDFDVVPWMRSILLQKLKQELARAILVGDGRAESDQYKIDATKIRPIWGDDSLFVLSATTAGLASFVEDTKLAMGDLLGSGSNTLYINPKTLTRLTLLKNGVGSYLFGGTVPSEAALASVLGVAKIQGTTFLKEGQAMIGNIGDYQLGNTKGGEITNFDDFDIDFNQYKYLTETYLSGALVSPKSFLNITITDPTTVAQFVVKNEQTNYVAPKEA